MVHQVFEAAEYRSITKKGVVIVDFQATWCKL